MTSGAPVRRGAWSLRRRLVVGIVALLAVVSLVVGVLSVVALRQTLISRLDEQVRDAVQRIAGPAGLPEGQGAAPDDGGSWDGPGLPGAGSALPQNRVGTLVLLERDGTVLRAEYVDDAGSTVELTQEQIDALDALDLRDDEVATADLDGLGQFRVAARQPAGSGDRVVVGLPTAEVTATVANLALIFGLVTLLALVIAALAGTQVVRVALRPLGRVTATARRVAELPLARGEVALGERVPDADPRTEVGQVGAAINRMLEHLESSLRARQESEQKVRQFVADASHELRTPLASIRGYSELTRRTGLELPEDIVFALGRIEAESVRMTSLVEDLLLLARLDAARESADAGRAALGAVRAEVDLVPLLAEAVADAHVAGGDHDWELDAVDEPVPVLGDANRLRQVFANLLANARIHTPAGSRVSATVAVEGGSAIVTIRDDGPGIPPELVTHVFERFARGDSSRSRGTGSTGLGLAIVAAVIEAHAGAVAVQSRPGDTRFVVRLPLAATSGENMERSAHRP